MTSKITQIPFLICILRFRFLIYKCTAIDADDLGHWVKEVTLFEVMKHIPLVSIKYLSIYLTSFLKNRCWHMKDDKKFFAFPPRRSLIGKI